MIYLDNNATTRVLDSAVEAMRPFYDELYANPASAVAEFIGIPRIIASHKERISKALGADSGEQFVVTSGATESNNMAILGAARAQPQRQHVIASAIEHPSVMQPLEVLRERGYRISILKVDTNGVVDLDTLRSLLSHDTLLVSVMLANNETGVIQPLSNIGSLVKAFDSDILFHTDATQAVGKFPINLSGELHDIDILSFSAHKFHGPKMVGGLFVREDDSVAPIVYGGSQQNGKRAGTENPAALTGMSVALTSILDNPNAMACVADLRDWLEASMLETFGGAFILSSSAPRLPTTTNVCFPGINAEDLVDRLAAQGIAVSAGSACAHGAQKPSYVASALGLTYEQAKGCVRVSLSIESTKADVDDFLAVLHETLPQVATTPLVGTTSYY